MLKSENKNMTTELFNQEFEVIIGPLKSYLLRITASIADAEDIVQDTFSSALTSWKNDTIPGNAEGWLFKVCKHKALNKIKVDIKSSSINQNFCGELTP